MALGTASRPAVRTSALFGETPTELSQGTKFLGHLLLGIKYPAHHLTGDVTEASPQATLPSPKHGRFAITQLCLTRARHSLASKNGQHSTEPPHPSRDNRPCPQHSINPAHRCHSRVQTTEKPSQASPKSITWGQHRTWAQHPTLAGRVDPFPSQARTLIFQVANQLQLAHDPRHLPPKRGKFHTQSSASRPPPPLTVLK